MASRAPSTAVLMLTAPCDPPLTSSVGRSGSSPNDSRASAGVTIGCVIERLMGMPTRVPPRITVSGKVMPTKQAHRAPTLLAIPGSLLASWTTTGTRASRAAM